MADNQQEPNEENTEGIQISEQAAEEENQDQSQDADNAGNEEGSQEPKVTFDDKQQAKVNDLIGKKVAKTHEETRRADEAERQLAELQASQPKTEAPEIPPMPDPDDFYGDPNGLKAAQDARDTVISERAKFDAGVEQQNQFQADQTVRQQQERAQKQRETFASYAETADTFGIKNDQMLKDAFILGQSLSNEVQGFIAEDAQGPLIANHLATDILELDKLRSMTPMQASIHIETEIRPKLASTRKATNTPAPAEIVDGASVPEKSSPFLQGVKFE